MYQILISQQDIPYLSLMGELWGAYYENFEENWLWYNGTALYGDTIWSSYEYWI